MKDSSPISATGDPEGTPDARPSAAPAQHRLGFLISDGAGTVLAVQDAIQRGALPGCSIALVICNITGAPGPEAVREAGLRVVTLEGRGRDQRDHEETLDALLRKMAVDVVCLSGYLRMLSREFIHRWPQRILTCHGSLLPAFPGARPERQAVEFGAQMTGCTLSLLDEFAEPVHCGPVVVQRAIPLTATDTEFTVKQRLTPEEHEAYIEAVRRVTSGQYELRDRRYVPRVGTGPKPVSGVTAYSESGSGTAGIRAAGSAPGR